MSKELVLTKTPPSPPADWMAEKMNETEVYGFAKIPDAGRVSARDMVKGALDAGWRKGWRGAIEHVTDQIAGLDIVVAERLRIAKLFCKDCESGRVRVVSTLGGREPFWHHPTGQASGRECTATALWGEARA